MKKKLIAYILVLIIAIISFMGISVEAKEAMTISKKTYIHTGQKTNTKFYTNKGYAYCITPRRTGPDVGASLKFQKEINNGGILYLLEKTGTSDFDYLATQLAIWQYDSQYIPDYFVSNPNYEVVKKSKTLASEANKNRNYTSKQPSVDVKASSYKLAITSDGKYYKSQAITITSSNLTGNAKYELSGAPSGAGFEKVGNNIYVVVPSKNVTSSTTFKFVASGTGTYNTVERYTTGNSSLQDLIVLIKNKKSVSKSVVFSITPVKRNCEVVDGHYFDNNGNEVDKDTYTARCVHKCVIYDGKYFGPDGKVTDSTTYELKCKKHSCQVIDGHYFDKDGKEVDKDAYVASCSHKCVIYDGKYYGPDGKVTDASTYELKCGSHHCEVVDGHYFDKNGVEVTSEVYNLTCVKHTCENINGRYFGRDGFEVSQNEYLQQCVHVCEIFENQYYGSQGTVVSESDYKAQCEAQVVVVPDTGIGLFEGMFSIMFGSALLGGLGGGLAHLKSKRV